MIYNMDYKKTNLKYILHKNNLIGGAPPVRRT